MDIELDEETENTLRERARMYGSQSAEEYAAIVIRNVLDELEDDSGDAELEERLEDLGYL